MAHELGHYLLGHQTGASSFSGQFASMGEWARAQEPKELDANAKAVEVLVRVKSWSEATALRVMLDFLAPGIRADAQVGRARPGIHPPVWRSRTSQGGFPRMTPSRGRSSVLPVDE